MHAERVYAKSIRQIELRHSEPPHSMRVTCMGMERENGATLKDVQRTVG